jgi:hypothetical protein
LPGLIVEFAIENDCDCPIHGHCGDVGIARGVEGAHARTRQDEHAEKTRDREPHVYG